MERQTVIVIFCDGTLGSSKYKPKPHEAAPISAYRRSTDQGGHDYWHPIYAVKFRGADHVLETNSTDQLVDKTELTLPDYSGVEQLPVNSLRRSPRSAERQKTSGNRIGWTRSGCARRRVGNGARNTVGTARNPTVTTCHSTTSQRCIGCSTCTRRGAKSPWPGSRIG